jgi:hypothetical protein
VGSGVGFDWVQGLGLIGFRGLVQTPILLSMYHLGTAMKFC